MVAATVSAALLGDITPLLDAVAHYVLTRATDEQLIAPWEPANLQGSRMGSVNENLRDLKAATNVG